MKPDVFQLRKTILKLAVNGELTGENIKEWRQGKLSEFIDLNYGKGIDKEDRDINGLYPVYGANGELGRTNKILVDEPAVIIGRKGTAGAVNIVEPNFWASDVTYFVTAGANFTIKYVYYLLKSLNLEQYAHGVKPGVSRKHVYDINIKVPDTVTQKRIVDKVDELMLLCDELDSKSDTFVEALENLRQTILQLAVEGKLVAQDLNEEPAEVLVKKLEAEKRKHLSEGRIRKNQSSPPLSDDELPFTLPNTWLWLRLGDVGEAKTGKTPPTSNKDNYGGSIGFIGPGQISKSRVKGLANTVSETGLNYTVTARPSSTLMVCIGGSIGKSVYLEEELSFNQQINSISPYNTINDKFIYYVLTSTYFLRDLHNKSSGAATPIINLGKWTKIPIPVPPAEEQKRIVEKVQSLMSLCDELESKLSVTV